MANVGYINKEVAKMYGIPYSELTPEQKKILHEDSVRRAKLIKEREEAVLKNNLKAFEDEAKMEKVLASIYASCQKEILASVTETIAKVQKAGGEWSYANQSALTRSRGLFEQIGEQIKALGQKEQITFRQGLSNIYTDQFLRQVYDLGQSITVKANFNRLNPALVQKTLDYPWSGAMFSDRLWQDKERLGRNLRVGLTQSMILGEGIPQITDRINKGIDTARYNAERVARTETKRVTYCAHDDVYKDTRVEELRYRCANGGDSRTCQYCRADNGKVFKRGEEPTLPRHPNCRCVYIPVVSDTFGDNELNELTGSVRGAENYEKWEKAQKEKLKSDKDIHTDHIDDAEAVKQISEIRKKVKLKGSIEETDLHDAGNILMAHLKTTDLSSQLAPLDKKVSELKFTMDEKYKELSKIMWDPNKDEKIYAKLREEYFKLSSEYKVERANLTKLRQDLSESTLVKVLGKIRDVGYTDTKYIANHLGQKTANVKNVQKLSIMRAYNGYPTDWVVQSVNKGNLTVKKVKRGYYSGWRNEIAISGETMEDCIDTAYHELGHRIEDTITEVLQAEKVFYDRRTKGEDLKWLGGVYARSEKTRKDNFLNPYMGKDYGGSAYELVSMGFQYAYTDATHLWEDPDYATFIYGLLCLV